MQNISIMQKYSDWILKTYCPRAQCNFLFLLGYINRSPQDHSASPLSSSQKVSSWEKKGKMLRSVAEQPKSANLCSVHIISFRSVQRSSFKLNHCTLAYETASNYTKITKREKGGSTIELKCHEFPLHPHFPFLDDSVFQRWKWRHWWQC